MFTVALIGPDGSGKSTISQRIESDFPGRVERIYMGINRSESNYKLPTTHLLIFLKRVFKKDSDQRGPRSVSTTKTKSKNPIKRLFREVKSAVRLIDTLMEETYRQFVTWSFTRRGYVVIFDRHFYADFYDHTINEVNREDRWTSRVHGYFLQHLYPKPELVIYLDAPAEVLYQRKGEGTIELLEERRQSYLSLQSSVPCFVIVDVTASVDEVYKTVENLILSFKDEGCRK